MPPSTQSFIKRLARLAPQLGSSGTPNTQLAQQVGELFPGGGPSTTTPWGGGGGTIMPPTTTTPPSIGVGPPSPRTVPVMPQISPASIAAQAPNAAPASDSKIPPAVLEGFIGTGEALASGGDGPGYPTFPDWTPPSWMPMGRPNMDGTEVTPPSAKDILNARPATLSDIPMVKEGDYKDVDSYIDAQRARTEAIGKFYGLDQAQIKAVLGKADQQMVIAQMDPKITQRQAADMAYLAIQKELATTEGQIAGVTDKAEAADTTNPFATPASGPSVVSSALESPFAKYGIYTPEQQIQMQATIGQFVKGREAAYVAGGGTIDPGMSEAYMRQAQAMPAIQAFQNAAQLAKQNQDWEAKYNEYQRDMQFQMWLQQQQMAGQSSSGGAATASDFASMAQQQGVNLSGGGQ